MSVEPAAGPRFLVLGGSGLIGQRLLRRLGPAAIGTYRRHAFPGGIAFDLAGGDVAALIAQAGGQFTHGVILGATATIDTCARDPAGTAAVNVAGAIAAIDVFIAHGLVPVFASSDAVYDGSRGNWREDDATRPILVYGRQKAEVEHYLAARREPWIALRIAKVLDAELSAPGVIGPWLKALAEGELIRCAIDQRFNPLGVDDVVDAISLLAASGAHGLFNLGGGESLSRYDLLERTIAAAAPYRRLRPVVEKLSLRDLPFAEKRPLDLSLSIAKLQDAVPYRPEPLARLCERAARNAFATGAN